MKDAKKEAVRWETEVNEGRYQRCEQDFLG